MISKRKFSALIKKASQPLTISEKSKSPKHDGDYSGKQTHQRKTVNTLEKRSGKSR